MQTGQHQESVWDYPRPPRLEPSPRHVRVVFAGVEVAGSRRAWRVLETSHPPSWYLPPEDVRTELLRPSPRRTWCEWKGQARYFSLVVAGREAKDAAWSYPDPSPGFEPLRDHLAFYPARVDACYVEGEQVRPQAGGFYGGWVTSDLVGPFKGEPGSEGW
jgi:uncharacterized protein (DUF427 family)